MSTPFKPLTEDFSVSAQLSPDDVAAVAEAGFKSLIINRPDFEEGPAQPASADVMAAARAAGLHVEYQPVVSGAMTPEDVATFAGLLKRLPAPVLAYCRSGTRCTKLFEAAQAL